jgi:hypothetical protein
MNKGCHNCKWSVGQYCEHPNGSDCNWVGELFRGQSNSWASWEPKIPTQAISNEKKTVSVLLRELADVLETK